MRPRNAFLVLSLTTLVSLVWVAIPVFLIRPFETQTPRDIAVAYALRSRSEWVTLALLASGVYAAFALVTKRRSWRSGTFAGMCVVLLAGLAFLARQNHFEWMFGPLSGPEFIAAVEATHVADDDLVLGVQVGEDAVAYPVRALAYHHVVNDVVGGEPIVATY